MRRVFKGGALVAAIIAILMAPAIYADDPPSPFDPPEGRISPPIGVATEGRISPPIGGQARISPPIGAQGRVSPPIGAGARIRIPGGTQENLSAFEQFWAWLQAGLLPPTD